MTTPEPIVDTHVHLWDFSHPELAWSWIAEDGDHPILGNIDAIRMPAFTPPALRAESRFAGVRAYVHVQAAIGSADPTEETRWLTSMNASHGIPNAIVGHADLGVEDAEAVLDEHSASPLFRGIRDFAVEPYLAEGSLSSAFERSMASLSRRGLVLEIDCEYPNMPAARALAERHPELVVVLEHIGFPRRRDAGYFAGWQTALSELAGAPNVFCKISGVGMTDPLFTPDSLRPWIRHCVEAFGPARCMFGSNWPLDRLFSSYDSIINVYRGAIAEDTADEQAEMLAGTASRIYRL